MWNREENRQLYKDYYRNQAGGTMPVFVGRHYQRGHGLAQTIGGLFKRFVMPIVVPAAKHIDKQILGNVAKRGMEVARDVIVGRNIKETLKDRGLAGIKRTVAEIADQSLVDKQRPQKKKKKRPPASLIKTRPPHWRQQKGGRACGRSSHIFHNNVDE